VLGYLHERNERVAPVRGTSGDKDLAAGMPVDVEEAAGSRAVALPGAPEPCAGFLANLDSEGAVASAPAVAETPVDVADAPLPEPEKTELEKEYERLYGKFLAELEPPTLGRRYRIRLRDRRQVEGKLVDIKPGRASLSVKYGTMTYAIHQIHQSSIPRLFPERLARQKALQTLADMQALKAQEQAAAAAAAPEPAAVAVVSPVAEAGPAPAAASPVQERVTRVQYDPSPGKTPPHLKDAVVAFGGWLEFQHRRVGGKIADKIRAKQQAQSVVLYLNMNPAFLAQDYDTRFQLAEGLQKFWAFRCEAVGVIRSLDDAHIVLLDGSDRIVGGSTPAASGDVWVDKGKRTTTASRE